MNRVVLYVLISFFFVLLCQGQLSAQTYRSETRKGNKAFQDKGEFGAAVTHYKAALRADSLNIPAIYNMAYELHCDDRDSSKRAEKDSLALQYLDKLAEKIKGSEYEFDYNFNRGVICADMKDWQGAVDAFKQCLKLAPGDMKALENYVYAKEHLRKEQQQQGQKDDQKNDDQKKDDQNQDQQQQQGQNDDQKNGDQKKDDQKKDDQNGDQKNDDQKNDDQKKDGQNKDDQKKDDQNGDQKNDDQKNDDQKNDDQKNDDQKNDQNKDGQDKNDKNDQQNQGGGQPDQSKISQQAAQQMLQAIQDKEKKTQDKVNQKKAAFIQSKQKQKNW